MPNARPGLHQARAPARRHGAPARPARRRARPRRRCGRAAPRCRRNRQLGDRRDAGTRRCRYRTAGRPAPPACRGAAGPATENCAHWSVAEHELHVELRPQHLVAELHVLEHALRIGGGRGHEEAIVGEARRRAVVEHEAVLAQHHAVTRASDRQGGERVDVEAIEERAGVRALDIDLAQRGHVAEADRRADSAHLAVDRLAPLALAVAREVLRAQPRPGFHEDRALLGAPTRASA